MRKTLEDEVMCTYGEKIDDVALGLMKGNFKVMEIERSMNGGWVETTMRLVVDGVEVEMEFTKRVRDRGC